MQSVLAHYLLLNQRVPHSWLKKYTYGCLTECHVFFLDICRTAASLLILQAWTLMVTPYHHCYNTWRHTKVIGPVRLEHQIVLMHLKKMRKSWVITRYLCCWSHMADPLQEQPVHLTELKAAIFRTSWSLEISLTPWQNGSKIFFKGNLSKCSSFN